MFVGDEINSFFFFYFIRSRFQENVIYVINSIGGFAKNSNSVIKHQLGEAVTYPARRYNTIKFDAMFPSAFNKLAV